MRVSKAMRKTVLGLLIGLGVTAFSQHPPAKSGANAAPKPVSHYMRETGLLYLEDVESTLEQSRKDGLEGSTDDSLSQIHAKSLDGLENRIEINVSSSGDRQYFELLKRTRLAAQQSADISNLAGHRRTVEEATEFGKELDMYPECYAQAMWVAKSGVFKAGKCTEERLVRTWRVVLDEESKAAESDLVNSRERLAHTLCGNSATYETCADAHILEERIHHESTPTARPQPISEELRTKCLPFVDGSVDKALAKAMPLPPRECREVVGWMRDNRLGALYDEQPKEK